MCARVIESAIGFSWKSNQFGLTVDTIDSFELVKPSGEIVNVTAQSDADLFFGLKVDGDCCEHGY